jgi:hypothetical protein
LLLSSCKVNGNKNFHVSGSRDIICENQDSIILERVLKKLEPYKDLSIGELVVLTGKEFIGTPYVAKTLEKGEKESLVINLREFDCTTLVESSLAISRVIKKGELTFDSFADELEKVRYRNGELNGYISRLHYFTEWIADNSKSEIVEDVTAHVGGKEYPVSLGFMSTHPQYYPQLTADSTLITEIAQIEKRVSGIPFHFIPKDELTSFTHKIKDGDIAAITTSVKGLGISHVGIMLIKNNNVFFLHASSDAKKVVISEGSFSGYLNRSKNTGTMVIRPVF